MERRIEQFDLLKGIGIILVVIGHCSISKYFHSIIYSFHMPLFFIVSGFFYYKQKTSSLLFKTIRHLLLPYSFFVILNFLFSVIFKVVSTHNIVEATTSTISIIEPLNEDCYILFRSIWFIIVLFLVINIYNILSQIMGHYLLIILSLICYLCGYLLQFYVDIPFFIDTTLSVIFYYSFGNITSIIYNKYGTPHKFTIFIGSLLFIVFIFCAIIFHPKIDYKYNEFVWWTPFLSIPMTISLYFICILINSSHSVLILAIKKILLVCGFFSLSILGFHRLFQDLFFAVYNKLGIVWGNLQTLIFVIISLPLIFLLSLFLQKYMPALIGVKKKA